MIKFKKIMQKAGGESSARSMASFMSTAPRTPGATAVAQDIAEEEPAEPVTPETTTAAQGAKEESVITDELVTSVLDDMFPSHAAETADDNDMPAGDETVEESVSETAEEAFDVEWMSEGPDTQAAKEALLEDDVQVIFEQDAPAEEAQAHAGPVEDMAQDVFEDAQTLEATPDAQTPAEDIPAEDTVTLRDSISEAAEGALDTKTSAEEEAPEENAPTASEGDPVEEMISDAFAAIDSPAEKEQPSEESEEVEEEAAPGLDSNFMSEVDRLLTEFGQVDQEAPARETVESEDEDVSMQITKIEEEMAAIATDTADAEDGNAAEEAMLEEPPGDAPVDKAAEEEEDFADTLSPEEREALFAEGPDAQVSLPSDAMAPDATGELAEVELDFTPDTVGLIGPDEETPPEDDDEDLLSRVLSDLDKLGDVAKPPDAADEAEKPDTEDEIDDFSNILDEINAEEDQIGAALAGEEAAALPQNKASVKAEVLSKSDEQLVAEALDAGDEDVDVNALGEIGKAVSSAPDSRARPDKPAANVKSSPEKTDEPDGGEDDVSEDADEAGGLQDQDALLASLQASMDAAKADDKQDADDSDREEEAIRDEVLSRSKEVEQKVLDDVFGSDKDFRAELKAEMNQMEDAGAGHAEQSSALAAESQRLATERGASGSEAAMAANLPAWIQNLDWTVWAAYQINRPFQRFLNPERLKLLSNIALALMLAAATWLAVAIMLFFQRF